MIAPRIACLVAALVLAAPFTLLAQKEPDVAPGDRVRVAAPNIVRELMTERQRRRRLGPPPPIYGSVVGLRADTLMVTLEGGNMPTAFPISSVAKLEVSRGKKSNVGRGALIGGLAGASLGAIVAAGACSADLPFGAKPSCSEGDVVAIVALFTVPVTGIGALIGAVTKADRWEDVPLDRIRLGPSPVAADGLALSATLRL